MPTLESTLSNIRNFISDVESLHPKFVAAAAITATGLIGDRVGETGVSADGSQLGEYSDGVYKKKRADKGHPTGYVNLRFTGAMWHDVKLLDVNTTQGLTVATIGGTLPDTQDKLFYNSVRYNDEILELSSSEESVINDYLNNQLQNLADKNFR